MIVLANAELERRPAKATAWAKKALEIDPSIAEAYVLIGTAEQMSGHAAEARAAYERYLELAPDGKHADELKAIVAELSRAPAPRGR
jgi:Tfp pilus assembly protein PilF